MREQKKRGSSQEDEVEAPAEAVKQESGVSEATDDLLAEIDDVLEVNAEEFVKGYVQKGGQ